MAKNTEKRIAGVNIFRFDLLQKMLEEVQDYAIILLDAHGTIVNWNLGAEKIKGYTEEEILGKNFSIFYLPEDRENKLPEQLISRAKTEGRALHEGWRMRKDGSRFWGIITITALHDEHGAVVGFAKVTRDLSERKLAEDRVKQYAADLEVRNRELEQFAYIASHDLQEPMRKIQTFIQLIDKNPADPKAAKKYLDKINGSAQRMEALIRAILNYSRLTNYEERFVDVDLNVVLELVKSDLELRIKEKEALLLNDPLPTVNAIPLQMNQLFTNLIGNSLKFSQGRPQIKISARVVSSEGMEEVKGQERKKFFHELVFEDNGIGFDQQYEAHIFTMFRRLHSNQDYPGTGIGLALCKKIAENHHGFMRASGQLGKGASFRIYLPVKRR